MYLRELEVLGLKYLNSNFRSFVLKKYFLDILKEIKDVHNKYLAKVYKDLAFSIYIGAE